MPEILDLSQQRLHSYSVALEGVFIEMPVQGTGPEGLASTCKQKNLTETQRRIPEYKNGQQAWVLPRMAPDRCAAPPRDTALTSVSLFESSRYSRSFSPSRRHGRRLRELERPALEQVQQLEQLRSCLGACCLKPVSEAETSTGGSREVQNLVVRDTDSGSSLPCSPHGHAHLDRWIEM